MFQTTRDYLASYITCTGSATIINILLLLLTAAMAVLGYYIVKRLLEIVERIILHSPTDWDDDLIDMRLLKAISQLAPAIIVRWVLPGFSAATQHRSTGSRLLRRCISYGQLCVSSLSS